MIDPYAHGSHHFHFHTFHARESAPYFEIPSQAILIVLES
jgi:hypothetical protein